MKNQVTITKLWQYNPRHPVWSFEGSVEGRDICGTYKEGSDLGAFYFASNRHYVASERKCDLIRAELNRTISAVKIAERMEFEQTDEAFLAQDYDDDVAAYDAAHGIR